MEITNFNKVSISGRYIYGYLCLLGSLDYYNEPKLPNQIDLLLKEFVQTDVLEVWHENIEELLPSIILQKDFNSGYFEVIDNNLYDVVRDFYLGLRKVSLEILNNLFALGFSNLYGAFDSSDSMEYLENIIILMKDNEIELPSFEIIKNCSVKQRNGWGNLTNMDNYLP
jgi:hypothetical protein